MASTDGDVKLILQGPGYKTRQLHIELKEMLERVGYTVKENSMDVGNHQEIRIAFLRVSR